MLVSYTHPTFNLPTTLDWIARPDGHRQTKSHVEETEKGYILTLDLPGVAVSDIDIELTGQNLKLATTRFRGESEEKRNYGWRLPRNASGKSVKANLLHGVLTLEIHKKASETPRKIQIEEGAATSVS